MFSHKINMQETLHQAAHSVSSAFNNCKENYDWIHSNYFKMKQQKMRMSGQLLILAAEKSASAGRILSARVS